MTLSSLQSVIDFFLNCCLNVWNVFKQSNAIIFAILVTLCLYPIFRRIMRAIRGQK